LAISLHTNFRPLTCKDDPQLLVPASKYTPILNFKTTSDHENIVAERVNSILKYEFRLVDILRTY